MLEAITISRFKTIRSLKLEFGRVNIFIGGNGTGKSNLLEAIGLLSACLGRGLGDADIGAKGLRITPPELMKSSFKNEDLPKTLELVGHFSGGIGYKAILQSREGDPLLRFFAESAKFQGERVFGRSNRGARATGVPHADRLDQGRGIWDQIKATYDIPTEVAETFAAFSRYLIYSPQTDFLRGRKSGSVDAPPIGLRGEGLPEAVPAFLRQWNKLRLAEDKNDGSGGVDWEIIRDSAHLIGLPGWASSFGVHRGDPALTSRDVADRGKDTVYFVDRYMHASRNQLSVYDSSEGTLFLLFAAIILAHPDAPKIFALDNVDNALNPKLTRHLIEQIVRVVSLNSDRSQGLGARQVFLTSHNPTALDAFDLFDDDLRVFVVRRNERGYTTAERLQPHPGTTREDWQLLMEGRKLSQLWLDEEIPGAMGDL